MKEFIMKLKYLPASLDKKKLCADSFVTPKTSVKELETQDSAYLGIQEVRHKVREIGQLRRAKMHTSCLIGNLDIKSALSPALRELLEASLTLQTTSTKILAAYLKRSPATIRIEFLRILSILGERSRHFRV